MVRKHFTDLFFIIFFLSNLSLSGVAYGQIFNFFHYIPHAYHPTNTCTPVVLPNTPTDIPAIISILTNTPTPTCTPRINGGLVTTLAGSGATGAANGKGPKASFNEPLGITVDVSGNIYIADTYNFLIRKIAPGGMVATLAGGARGRALNGYGTDAAFYYPSGVAVDQSGNIYVADSDDNLIRKITPDGLVTVLAGSGTSGADNGPGNFASFNYPWGIAVDASGNVYVADYGNDLIRKIFAGPGGMVSTLAGSGSKGAVNGAGTSASFNGPTGVAVDTSGNVYVADCNNNLIRKIAPDGMVATFAGSGAYGSDNGMGTAASGYWPAGIAVDDYGNVYVADCSNNLIRKITPAGEVTTLAWSGTSGSTNGVGSAASFYWPSGIAADAFGNVYVGDTNNNLIRKIQ